MDENIFKYTDEDGDRTSVWDYSMPNGDRYLVVRQYDTDGQRASVRMRSESVRGLRDALNNWLGKDHDVRCTVCESAYGRQCIRTDGHDGTHEYVPASEPEPEVTVDMLLRLNALNLAVQSRSTMSPLEIAREFEAYLRGETP